MKRRSLLQAAAGGLTCALLPARPSAAGAGKRRHSRSKTRAHNEQVLESLLDLETPLLRWRWIVIHHTASEHSSLARIDAYHRRRFDDPLGCQYHFLIHNGKKGPEGWIEPARWRHQERAVHLFKPHLAPEAVAISLVGNFEKRRPRERQLRPVVQLVSRLVDRLGIPLERVTTHRRVDGRLTQCPGKRFPYEEVMRRLAEG